MRTSQALHVHTPLAKRPRRFLRAPSVSLPAQHDAWKSLVLSCFAYNMHGWSWLVGRIAFYDM